MMMLIRIFELFEKHCFSITSGGVLEKGCQPPGKKIWRECMYEKKKSLHYYLCLYPRKRQYSTPKKESAYLFVLQTFRNSIVSARHHNSPQSQYDGALVSQKQGCLEGWVGCQKLVTGCRRLGGRPYIIGSRYALFFLVCALFRLAEATELNSEIA